MKAMILAAGFGTRLRPLTETTPKPLLPVRGTPLIVWNLLMLREAGIRDVMVNLHYLGHMIQETLGDGTRWGMRVSYSYERQILGTGGALKAVEKYFEGQPFLVVNGDTLIALHVQGLISLHAKKGGVATLVLRDDPDAQRWGAVETDAADRILRITGEGVPSNPQIETPLIRMFAGAHIVDPLVLRGWSDGQSFSIIEPYVQELSRGSRMFGYLHDGYWSDIGTIERYAQTQADVEAGLMSLPSSPKG